MVGRKCWEDVGVLAPLEGREVSVNGTAERERDSQNIRLAFEHTKESYVAGQQAN